jgi:hypothetical protein
MILLLLRAMERLLEDRLRLVDLKLGLEVGDVVREAAAVGATARVGKGELLVSDIIVDGSPVGCVSVLWRQQAWVRLR